MLTGLEIGEIYIYLCPGDYQFLQDIKDSGDDSWDVLVDCDGDLSFLDEFTFLDTSAENVVQAGYYASSNSVDSSCLLTWAESDSYCSNLEYYTTGGGLVIINSHQGIGGL